jgi:hypothetical protein
MNRKKFFNASALLTLVPFLPKRLLTIGEVGKPQIDYSGAYTKQGWNPTLQMQMVTMPRPGWPVVGMEILNGVWLNKYLSTKSKEVCANYSYSTVHEYHEFGPEGIFRRARLVQYLGAKVRGEITEQVVAKFCKVINEVCDEGAMWHACLEFPFSCKSDPEKLEVNPDCDYTLHFYAVGTMDAIEFRKKYKYTTFEGEWPRYFI